jgi:hypothetical protein
MEGRVKVYLPKWATVVYATMAVVLIPWILNLASTLPERHLERHWDAVWVGFDFIMLCTIVLTLWFMFKRVIWVVVSASALGALLIVDAWFDIMTAKPGSELREAILYGVLEVSLAVLTYRLVYVMVHHTTPQKNISLHLSNKRP